ncbi:MAG: phosphate acyltransferase [Verrucomicrobiales bacterium]
MEKRSQVQAAAAFIDPLLEKLRRHPKRIVFTEGEDIRVLRVAARLVQEEAVVPILLGARQKITSLAESEGICLDFIKILNPEEASDFELFCERYAKIERYRTGRDVDAASFVKLPHYFGALMVQYGQADALVGGNQVMPAVLFRALNHAIKPLSEVGKMFGVTVLSAPHLDHFGGSGMLLFADSGLNPEPSVDELCAIAIETGKLARHFLGREVKVAFLSHSTKGSAPSESSRKVAAATALARERVSADSLELRVTGEVQADVALDAAAAEVKMPDAEFSASADVLVFPNLDSAHISMKLLQHCAGARNYGHLLMGLARPAAQVPRTASEDTIFGTAAAVAVEAIKFHEMFPEADF